MSKIVGPSLQLVSVEPSFDPKTGFRSTFTWRGGRAAITSKGDQLAAAGLQFRITQNGASYTLVATFPDPNDGSGGGTPPTGAVAEVWEFDMEDEMISVWNLPAVIEAIEVAEAAGHSPAEIRRFVERVVKDGGQRAAIELNGVPAFVNDRLGQVYDLLVRGVEAIPVKRPVLARTRTFPLTNPGRVKLSLLPDAYTRAAFIATFNVPADIALQIPDEPLDAPPVGTFWGWRLRLDRTRFVGSLAKTEESRDWVFYAWPLLAFNKIG